MLWTIYLKEVEYHNLVNQALIQEGARGCMTDLHMELAVNDINRECTAHCVPL